MPQITFQQGVDGYTGTLDTMVREKNSGTNYGGATTLHVDAADQDISGQDSQILLEFSNLFGNGSAQIPKGAHITKAELTLQNTNAGDGAALHRVLADWTEKSTWKSMSGGIQADGTEAVAAPDVVTGKQPGSGTSTFDVTSSVQAWSSGADNHGWAFMPSGTDGWDFSSSEGRTAPKLTVTYTLDPTTPTDPGTPGATAPVAADDRAGTKQGTPVTVAVLTNDSDPNGDALRVDAITTAPGHGQAAINPDGTITYTPADSFLGDDSFAYSISDGQGGLDTATVAVSVSAPASAPFSGSISPKVETAAVAGSGDVADDPAIWVDRNNPERSVVIGTDKDPSKGCLYVFDLQGHVVSTTPSGEELNNVDLRYNFKLGGISVDLIGATNRGTDSIDFFAMDPETRQLHAVGSVPTGLSHIYGFTMAHAPDGKYYAFVSTTGAQEDSSASTTIRQFELDGSSGKVTGTAVRTFSPGIQVEGMVADDRAGALYVSQEDVGIWRYGADPASGSARTQVDKVGGGHLTADVEGLSIYYGPNGTGYLIASSQGSDSYALYDRSGSNSYLGSFKVVAGNGVDGATDTDGLDVTNMALGSAFPSGMLVVHDNSNSGASSSNFKLVSWDHLADLGGLITNPTYNPIDGIL